MRRCTAAGSYPLSESPAIFRCHQDLPCHFKSLCSVACTSPPGACSGPPHTRAPDLSPSRSLLPSQWPLTAVPHGAASLRPALVPSLRPPPRVDRWSPFKPVLPAIEAVACALLRNDTSRCVLGVPRFLESAASFFLSPKRGAKKRPFCIPPPVLVLQ